MSSSSSDARLRTRNESRQTSVDRIVIMHPDGMAAVPEIPQSFWTVHSFAQGQDAGFFAPHSFLAADSLVDHSDLGVRIFDLKKRQQSLRIGLDVAFAGRRRRTDRDDLGPPSNEALCKTGQVALTTDRPHAERYYSL